MIIDWKNDFFAGAEGVNQKKRIAEKKLPEGRKKIREEKVFQERDEVIEGISDKKSDKE